MIGSYADDEIVIVGMSRTPIGNFQGELSNASGPELGGFAIEAAINNASISASDVDDVIMGCVLPAGLGQAPARQAALKGSIPLSAGATTVNKMCGSGMRAVMLGFDQLVAGSSEITVAGGFESMTNDRPVNDGSRLCSQEA